MLVVVPNERVAVNWDVIGATGEWAAAFAVVASFLYLARQIHHSTKQAKAAARFLFLDAYGKTTAAIFQTKETASIYRRGLEGEIEDSDEAVQFSLMLAQYINTWNVLYDLHEESELPDSQWELVEKDIHFVYSTAGGRKFWNEVGKPATNQRFINAVERILETEAEPYTILPPTRSK